MLGLDEPEMKRIQHFGVRTSEHLTFLPGEHPQSGWLTAKAGVRASVVVLLSPFFDDPRSMVNIGEPMRRQALVSKS
jgi:hypothetical protein